MKKKRVNKEHFVGFRIEEDKYIILQEIAEQQSRSVSNVIQYLITGLVFDFVIKNDITVK